MRKLASLALFLTMLVPTLALAQAQDPCLSPEVSKSSASIDISSATTTSIIAPVTGTTIHICAYNLTLGGTTPTAVLEYGTGATCGTGTTALSGAMTASSSFQGDIPIRPISQRFCILSAGTPTIKGHLTYTQQ